MKQGSNNEIIKLKVKSGDFFKDSKDWFYWKYISSYKSRFDLLILIMITFFIITFFIIYSLFSVISVKGKNGVVNIESLFESEFILQKIPKVYRSNEKNILRFILEKYVEVFENHNIDKFDLNKLDEKGIIIALNSSPTVDAFFNNNIKKNYENEIFGGIKRLGEITSFEFIYDKNDITQKIARYIMPEQTPKKVIINLKSTALNQKNNNSLKEEDRVIEIIFSYNKIKREVNGGFNNLNFKVVSYKYLSIS